MKQIIAIVSFSVSLFAGAYVHPATAAPVDNAAAKQAGASIIVDGKTITFDHASAQKVKTFRKTGAAFYYPTFVPARYTLSSVKFDKMGDPQHPDYQMEFCDKKHHFCFSIESAYSGIGDEGDGDRTLNGKSKFFGAFTIDVFKPGSEGNGGKNIYYLSSWLMDKKAIAADKKQMLISDTRFYHFLGKGINDKEAVAIVESLKPASH